MPPTTHDDFVVDDEASDAGSEDYNDNGYTHFYLKAFVINLMFSQVPR